MKYLKFLIIVYLSLLLISCSTIKEGFTNQKKNSSDEFLVEKKSPLVMPPDYNELLIPKQNGEELGIEANKIKKLVKSEDKLETSNGSTENRNESFDESILKKIKKN